MLSKAGDARVRVGRECGIVLVEVLKGKSVFGGGVVVDVGDSGVGFEAAGSGQEGVEGMCG